MADLRFLPPGLYAGDAVVLTINAAVNWLSVIAVVAWEGTGLRREVSAQVG